MDGGSAVVATVVVFKRLDELLEVELLVYLDEKVVGVYEISEALGGELKQRGVSAVAVQWIEHRFAPETEWFVPFYSAPHVCLQPRLFQQSDLSAVLTFTR